MRAIFHSLFVGVADVFRQMITHFLSLLCT